MTALAHLIYDDVIANARKAFEERRLQFQQHCGDSRCFYKMPGDPSIGCAIGVSLPDDFPEQLIKLGIHSNEFLDKLMRDGIVTGDRPAIDFITLQLAHDKIVENREWPTFRQEALTKFKELIHVQ